MTAHCRRARRATLVVASVLAVGVLAWVLAGCSSGTTSAGTSAGSTSSALTPAATSTADDHASGGQPQGGPAGSADTSTIKRKYSNVAYATKSSAEKLDLYLPNTGSGPFPLIISIHGGAFMMGDKVDGQLTPMLAGLDRGYAVASINYRFSNEAKFPAQINDVKAAIRFLRANATKYHLDPDKFAVWGGSAGGYLAALAGTSGGVSTLQDGSLGNATVSDKVQAVVDWFGPIDFATMDAQFQESGTGPANHNAANSPESQLLGAALPTVPGKVKASDPTTYISADDPPFLIEHGNKDANVPVQQSQNFASALKKVLGANDVTLKILPGAAHMDPAFDTTANVKLVLDWLDAHLK